MCVFVSVIVCVSVINVVVFVVVVVIVVATILRNHACFCAGMVQGSLTPPPPLYSAKSSVVRHC